MTKRKFKNRSYCRLESEIIESDAFLNLSGKAAMLCLIRFHQKAYKKRTGGRKRGDNNLVVTNNGQIVFTYGEAFELGIRSSNTFHRVLRELVEEKGFIDIAETGNWYERKPSRYSISNRWRHYGTPDYRPAKIGRILPRGKGFQGTQKTKLAAIDRSQ